MQGLKSTFASWEQRRDCGLLPANISLQTIEYIYFMTAKSNFNSKSGLPSWEEGPFLGAVLPRSLYFSGPVKMDQFLGCTQSLKMFGACTRARSVSHRRSDLRVWSLKEEMKMDKF